MPSNLTSITFSPGPADCLETVVHIIAEYKDDNYYAYERENCWYLGIGAYKSLLISSNGEEMTITMDQSKEVHPVTKPLADIAREFVHDNLQTGSRIFGQVGFNYASHIRGQSYTPGEWPLLALMAPRHEIRLQAGQVTVAGCDGQDVLNLCSLIKKSKDIGSSPCFQNIRTGHYQEEYSTLIRKALSEIDQGLYSKVIMSRAVDLHEAVDMPGTLLSGRRSNRPSRTFSLSHAGFQATGFSPELVMSVRDGTVTTEPLAGTRALPGDEAEVARLQKELETDSKEIIEHVISVKEAVNEINRLSDSALVEDFMTVRPRGAVQHLGSRVSGRLTAGKDVWNAFNVLFPSITASGIPKAAAVEAIQRLESRPRELYSGAVLMLEDTMSMEAALVLRTVFQDPNRQWIQAGAGIIAQSNPQREMTETREKLACIAPFIARKCA